MIGEYSILNGRLTYKMPEEIDHHMAKAIAMQNQRIASRRGKNRATVAVAHSMLIAIYHDSKMASLSTHKQRWVNTLNALQGMLG